MNQIAQNYKEYVRLNYDLFNSLFLTLPLDAVQETGNFIPLLNKKCQEGYDQGKDPEYILDKFFEDHQIPIESKQRLEFLFKVILYVERQIVLVDALEDAAFDKIHRVNGLYSLNRTLERVKEKGKSKELENFLKEFSIKLVLTAHPTQFYTNQVLGIIKELKNSIKENNVSSIRDHLYQLGKTPFYRKQKPEVIDEANSLIEFLNNTFYPSISLILDRIAGDYPNTEINSELLSLGFWPGGDRDGNPFVIADTSLEVARQLKKNIINNYLSDINYLKNKLTFKNVYDKIEALEKELLNNCKVEEFEHKLINIKNTIIKEHDSLFLEYLNSYIRKIKTFSYHFACLDFRQDSRKIFTAHEEFIINQKSIEEVEDDVIRDVAESIQIIHKIKSENGSKAVQRYIVSNNRDENDIIRLYELFQKFYPDTDNLDIDFVPLFETIEDLSSAHLSMEKLYSHPNYSKHLEQRNKKQTVMLGFSDGTKDGGYLMSNWSIYSAKSNISKVSTEKGFKVNFFDGRGGPPARGGGNTHLFYTSMGSDIQANSIQLTIQGQTISSQYGAVESAQHNIEYLLTAGIQNTTGIGLGKDLSQEDKELIITLSEIAYSKYSSLKEHPSFLPFLENRSTIKYYGKSNIGSRPSKRSGNSEFSFDDLRAIPFVGAWSQAKLNVPGFYGVGTAIQEYSESNGLEKIKELYNNSIFFRALINNCMQSMRKSFLPLTNYLIEDGNYGNFWRNINDEYHLTKNLVLEITDSDILLKDDHRSSESISLRENVVLPLLTIQQYALIKIEKEQDDEIKQKYERMIVRSLFGNINASRNSV